VLIADEAAYAQTWDAQRTQAMIRLARAPQCRATYLITGTPLRNGRPANLYPLLYALDHRLAQDKHWYERYYCAAHATEWTAWDISGAAHLDELHREIADILLRRRKQDCLDLPAKTRVRRPAEVSATMRERYEETLARLRVEYQRRVEAGEIMDKGELLVALNHLRQVGSLAKTETALALVEELAEQEQQVVVFTAFMDSAKQIVDALQAEGISAELLIGETPAKARAPLVKRFQVGQVRVLVCTLGTGGVGLTLTAASTVILVDRPWTPGDAEQAEDRLHRIGQREAVTAIWLAYGKIDQLIDDLLEEKAGHIGQVLGEPASLTPLDRLEEVARRLFAGSEDVVNEREI
jgi:SNF2 family DNA or RNA helicase